MILMVSITNALPVMNVNAYPTNQPSAGRTDSRELGKRKNGGYQQQTRDSAIHTRHPYSTDGSHITAHKTARGILNSVVRREEDLSWPGFRRGGTAMSHEEEMACRERGGTPERMGNGRAECSMNPVPIRRTVWRKRKSNVIDGASREAGDVHGR
ncbi:hypothetical protein BDZ94DRAFT_1248309 [Collybia nuda]|uniref:Uncharacterized protein n=1 Tax=Collybia nuda TaxID=64659 RepID=A0A9P5YCF9_9AGAR|nr:hypothetical protein BDZ94DRAFT_1248309 [Collybia nuda]